MISEAEKVVIKSIAAQYNVKKVLLFGSSSLSSHGEDIDLAVEGISPQTFFKFYGDLLFGLDKQVDLVDLSIDNSFNRLVREEGAPIYG